jgi:hypothetical protein
MFSWTKPKAWHRHIVICAVIIVINGPTSSLPRKESPIIQNQDVIVVPNGRVDDVGSRLLGYNHCCFSYLLMKPVSRKLKLLFLGMKENLSRV